MNAPITLPDVIEKARSIPCAPALLPRLLAAMQGADVNAQEIERLVHTDPALGAAVLRLANSAFFSLSRKCDNLAEAILRLGSVTIYHLAATSVAGRWLSQPVKAYGWEPGDICRHSLSVAIAAEALAESTALANPEIAYTAGLMHDVGRLALAFANGPALDLVAQRAEEDQRSWREIEREVLGYDSADVSRLLLCGWGFPVALVNVGALYATPASAPPEDAALVVLVHAAKHLVTQLGYGVGAEGFSGELDEGALAAHGFTEEALVAELPKILEKIQKFIEPDGHLILG